MVKRELRQARADNAALLRRLMMEREGAQLQLESTVAFWMDQVANITSTISNTTIPPSCE